MCEYNGKKKSLIYSVFVLIFLATVIMATGSEQETKPTAFLKVEEKSDTKGSIIQSEDPFHLSIDPSTVRHGWLTKEDNSTVYAIYGKGLFWTDDAEIPTETKYFGIAFGKIAKTGWIKHKHVDSSVWTTIESTEFSHLASYTFDNGGTYEHVYYTSFATIPANHTRDFKIYVELEDKPEKNNFIIYFGTGSTVLEVAIGTDLKVTQTGLDNETSYVASIDASEGKLFMGQTDSEYDLVSDLEGWWSFDNGNVTGTWGTTAYDYSGENNHGTLTGMNEGIDNGTSGWTTSGKYGNAVQFDGVNDYVEVTGSITLDNFTVCSWIRKTSGATSGDGVIFAGKSTTHYRIQYSTDKLIGYKNNVGGAISNAISNLDTQFVYVCMVSLGSNLTGYVNGQVGLTVTGSAGDDVSNDIDIGRRSTFNYFNGTIDEVKIYSRALSATEVEALYNITVDKYNTTAVTLHSSTVTHDIVSNENTSIVVEVPEVETKLSFTPTYVAINYSTIVFNTTDTSWFGQNTITVTNNYLDNANLTLLNITLASPMGIYDTELINLSAYGYYPIGTNKYFVYRKISDSERAWKGNYAVTWVDTCESGNTTGLVGCWNFNEGYGTSAHDRANNSVNNNDGTLTSMNEGINNGTSGWTTSGKYGNALSFDGDNDYVDCGADDSLNITGSVTYSAWIYNRNISLSYSGIIGKAPVSTRLIGLNMFINTGKISFFVQNQSVNYDYVISDSVISENAWTHVAGTFNRTNGQCLLYINGVQQSDTGCSITGDLWTGSSVYTTSIGRRGHFDQNYFNGTIDEVKIWNRALSADEISDEYELGRERLDLLLNEEGSQEAGYEWLILLINGTVPDYVLAKGATEGIDYQIYASKWDNHSLIINNTGTAVTANITVTQPGRNLWRISNTTNYIKKYTQYNYNVTAKEIYLYDFSYGDKVFKVFYSKLPATAAAAVGGAIATAMIIILRRRRR